MSITLTQLTQNALYDLGVLLPGQLATTDLLSAALAAANEMIETWQLDGLMIYANRVDTYTLTPAQQSYNIGPGQVAPHFNATRPTRITNAGILLNNVSPVVRRPLKVINVDERAEISVDAIPSAIPKELYYDYGFDPTAFFGTIFLWPGPLLDYQLELFTWQQLQSFADLTTAYTFPPGYQRALRKNLALEIAPLAKYYLKVDAPLFDVVAPQARETLAAIRSFNAPDPVQVCDPMFQGVSRKGGGWNYATGEPGTHR